MPKLKSQHIDIIATKAASEYVVSEPRFLWYPFLPYKKLVVLQGESGIGKSSFILTIASLLSNGRPMPFAESDTETDCGDTLYFNKEDDIEETVNPRLIAMGANRERLHIINEPFVFGNDCKRLQDTIIALGAKLVIIDPFTSFLSKSHNMNAAQSVGNLIRDLSKVAHDTGTAIVIVCHLTKNVLGKEINWHLGSSDIMNAARSVLSATRLNDDEDVVVVKHLKSTLSKKAKPFYYEIVENGIIEFSNGIDRPPDEPMSISKLESAKAALVELLTNGAKPQGEIKRIFADTGICGWRTVETAKSELGIKQFYDGEVSCWKLDT
jgi:hypothetical protein